MASFPIRVAIGSDHAGLRLRDTVKDRLVHHGDHCASATGG